MGEPAGAVRVRGDLPDVRHAPLLCLIQADKRDQRHELGIEHTGTSPCPWRRDWELSGHFFVPGADQQDGQAAGHCLLQQRTVKSPYQSRISQLDRSK